MSLEKINLYLTVLLVLCIAFYFSVPELYPLVEAGESKHTLLLLFFLLTIATFNFTRSFRLNRAQVDVFLLLILVYFVMIFSSFWSLYLNLDWVAIRVATYFILMFAAFFFWSSLVAYSGINPLYVLSVCVLLASIAHAVFGFLSYSGIAFISLQPIENDRMFGLSQPNFLSQTIACGVISLIYIVHNQKGFFKFILILVVLPFLMYCLIAAGSRGVILGLVLALFLFYSTFFLEFLKKDLFSKSIKLMFFLCLMLALPFFAFIVYDNFRLGPREYIFGESLKFFATGSFNEILFGKGYGQNSQHVRAVVGHGSHNDWIRLLVDLGMVGLLLIASSIFSIIAIVYRGLRKSNYSSSFVLASSAFFITVGFTNSGLFYMNYTHYMFFVAVLASGLSLKSRFTYCNRASDISKTSSI